MNDGSGGKLPRCPCVATTWWEVVYDPAFPPED